MQPPGLGGKAGAAPWALALAGFIAMYVPVYWWAAHTIWQTEEQGHGALVLLIVLWLFWTLRQPLAALPDRASPVGWPVMLIGLLVYLAGRVFNLSIFEFGSQVFIVAGCLLLLKGAPALRVGWFPVLYLIFMVPLPGVLVDAVTGPLKQWISAIVEQVLFTAGYPIAREGVTMTIGQYQLLVADACSGLNSMFSLSALGTLFMYLAARKSIAHNSVMLLSILPIAFAANIVRVIVLVLVTYHLGDEAGQGFLHGMAGLLLMFVALVIFFVLDYALVLLRRRLADQDGH